MWQSESIFSAYNGYRAVLQVILSQLPNWLCSSSLCQPNTLSVHRQMTNTQYPRLGRFKYHHKQSFTHFLIVALSRLYTRPINTPTNIETKNCPSLLAMCSKEIYRRYSESGVLQLMDIYTCLRLMLGPLIEDLILVDRYLFLDQDPSNLWVGLVPLFDPTISPRNVAVIALPTTIRQGPTQ